MDTQLKPLNKAIKLGLFGISLFGLLQGTQAVAQQQNAAQEEKENDVEVIMVTATKRASTLQEVPFSINAQSQADIERAGATNLEELSRNVAGLSIQNLGPGQSQVAIRGVSAGQVVRDQPGVKEQVGVYLDESVISLSLFTPDLDLYDLNRVETLRGPQGTLFGSGSIGGTIRYITNQPEADELAGSLELNLNSVTDGDTGGHIKGMVNVPLVDDKLAMRAVVYTTEYAGFIDALGENGSRKNDVNGGSRTGGRLALTWWATDQLTITPRVVYQEIDVDGFNRQEVFNMFANPYTTTRPAIQLGEREQYLLLDEGFKDETLIADITAEWELGSADMTFVYSYTDRDIMVSRDASALSGSVSVDLGFPDAAVLLPSNLRDRTQVEQDTVELRFSSNTDSALQWLFGVFYSDTQRQYSQRLPTPGYDAFTDAVLGEGTSAAVANGFPMNSPYNADLPYDLNQKSVFGELTYDVNDKLNLVLGSRFYDYEEERRFTTGGLFANGDDQVDSTSSDGFTSRFIANYELNETVNLNAQISQGFRLGGVNDPLNETLCQGSDLQTFGSFQNYDDEKLVNYEVGMKASAKRWGANMALFYTDISDLQVTLDAGSCSSRISFNVPEAHTVGLEYELTRRATDNLFVTLSGSFVQAEFDSTVRDGDGNVLGGVEEGNRLASVPEVQFALAGTYDFDSPLLGANDTYVSASFQYIGDRITQPSDQVEGAGNFVSGLPFGGASGTDVTALDLELDAYNTLNLSAGLVYDTWEAVLYINNVTDENANLSFDRERGGRARLAYRTNQPRTFGVTLRARF
ncbi:TonB-dependent receptor [Bowmanella yangjiangensis]|uniref:TonB-dependent receptor n=1 Tax=Bowmanella yangjiangensis TaxID=2811230 RepID=A0ABS3CWN4_9ALTE|nr:TonB-dependent receptor [Bowmanella yangjiangensis]MBN7820735.1 TonB-dependent receptor [Bowmanella yangjiangensis]